MAEVNKVAEFFVMLGNRNEDDQITNLKLNKLMYFAQGAYLARTGKPLFDEPIEVWPLGPVVPSVYSTYKPCGKRQIEYDENDDLDVEEFSLDEFEALIDVAREFGQYTGSRLISMTHKPGTLWSKANDAGSNIISQDDIKEYFLEHPIPAFRPNESIEHVTAFPADWYDPDEDAEYEAYL